MIILVGCLPFSGSPGPVQKAEELVALGEYHEAVRVYHAHIHERLMASERADWENPYFYLLFIGDIQLRMQEPGDALLSFIEAEREHVQSDLVSDRYRAVASWYIEHGQLEKALDILRTYRDRDSLLFDAMLDRVARLLTAQEASPRAPPKKRATTK